MNSKFDVISNDLTRLVKQEGTYLVIDTVFFFLLFFTTIVFFVNDSSYVEKILSSAGVGWFLSSIRFRERHIQTLECMQIQDATIEHLITTIEGPGSVHAKKT